MNTVTTHEQAFKFLTEEDLRIKVPAAYTAAAPNSRGPKGPKALQDYVPVETPRVLRDLEALGWKPVRATQMRADLPQNEGFQRHFIHLRNPKFFVGSPDDIEAIPELLLLNSYDARCSFTLYTEIYRTVSGTSSTLYKTSEQHRGCKVEEIAQKNEEFLANILNAIELLQRMKRVELYDRSLQKKLAEEAYVARWDYRKPKTNCENLLKPLRYEDEPNDLWTVYNRVQEKIIRGGWVGPGGRMVKPIDNPDRELKINKLFFKAAEHLLLQRENKRSAIV